jgi:hypothetical protein
MTTIAYKDGILACESLATKADMFCGYNRSKVTEYDKIIIAFSGDLINLEKFSAWYNDGRDPKSLPTYSDDGWGAFVISKETKEIEIFQFGVLVDVVHSFYTMGTGGAIATGAMAAGASAEEAVKIACEYDVYSGGEVHVYDLNSTPST